MKVGILTFHGALSYGASLQSYALQEFLNELGIETEIVDYRCDYMITHYQKLYRSYSKNFIRNFLISTKTAPGIIKKKKIRDRFNNRYLKLSCPFTKESVARSAELYDILISGSDQVWSPVCVGFDETYFLGFAAHHQKYSYAASVAVSKIPENLKDEYRKRLKDFQCISVREYSTVKLLEDLTGKEVHSNIDPTFLLNYDKWNKIAKNSRKERYILVFTVKKPFQLLTYAAKLGKEINCKVLYLNKGAWSAPKGIKSISPVDIEEFLGLIRDAEYVLTNSFHGMAFSILFHKKFMVETVFINSINIRSEELLSQLDMKGFILKSIEDRPPEDTDWDKVDSLIEAERSRSKKYLLSIFDDNHPE